MSVEVLIHAEASKRKDAAIDTLWRPSELQSMSSDVLFNERGGGSLRSRRKISALGATPSPVQYPSTVQILHVRLQLEAVSRYRVSG